MKNEEYIFIDIDTSFDIKCDERVIYAQISPIFITYYNLITYLNYDLYLIKDINKYYILI